MPVVPTVIRELTGTTTASAATYGDWLAFAYAGMQFFCAPIVAGAPAGIAMPALNAVMSRRGAANAQGTLQGAVGSLEGISAIVGPLVMTQLFSLFAAPTASPRVPGAPFFCAALLAVGAVLLLARAPQSPPESEQTTES